MPGDNTPTKTELNTLFLSDSGSTTTFPFFRYTELTIHLKVRLATQKLIGY